MELEEEIEPKLKLLQFNSVTNISQDEKGKYESLKNHGFTEFDHYLEIHINQFYQTGEKNLGLDLIKSDLAKIAEYIVDNEAETAAVIGKSWLLDSPIVSRLGFQSTEGGVGKENDPSTWFQFIDKNGEIDKKRFDKFIKTGELPYKSKIAYILVEDFLKRYLPIERRGKITLKKALPERKEFWQAISADGKKIGKTWEKSMETELDFTDFIDKTESLRLVLSFLSSKSQDIYLEFLKKMYQEKVGWNDVYQYYNEDIKKINLELKEQMVIDQYELQDVNI